MTNVLIWRTLVPPLAPTPDEHRCLKLKSFDKEIRIFSARKDYISQGYLEIEVHTQPYADLTQKLEARQRPWKDQDLEGKMTEFLPCPIALCPHNYKFKAVKRPADPVIRPAKFTAKAAKNNNSKTLNDFVFPKKTTKNAPTQKKDEVVTNNTFAALNTAQADAETSHFIQNKAHFRKKVIELIQP
ncbi:uncharacterized protein TNIN_130951 [Trichonephila inaurata madagascariensis]|uniref:Uncharacterized protein n=1 Tax=Trichonephila inaurata madagascariensis TaxID=2747483 RepID=A0A8X6YW68_9ARAC|nr:uncharacterized protein TNIN_130931 [Trichonephila inaurata madagascariensis]GFY78178.1 uncharacterized protein TNIN_130951 [Trichonephila inaurata madagascariensis]